MGFESPKQPKLKQSGPDTEATPLRYDQPEDLVDPQERAQEEARVWKMYGKKLDPQKRITEVGAAMAEKQPTIAELERRIREKEGDLTKLKEALIDRLLSWKRIRSLESDSEKLHTSMEREYGVLLRSAEFKEGFEQLFEEEERLAALVEEETRSAKEEAAARNVHEQALRHNCFFVHAIVEEDGKPSDNNATIDTKSASFNDQVAIINGVGPTLSASTVGFGTKHLTFNTTQGGLGSGVFLSAGRILAAAPADIGSRAVGLYERDLLPVGSEKKEAIEEAIATRASGDPDRYNELIIAEPEIAGVYFRFDNLIEDTEWELLNASTSKKENEPAYEHMLPMEMKDRVIKGKRTHAGLTKAAWEKFREAKAHGVPLYALTDDNKAYAITTIDEEGGFIGIEAGARTPAEVMGTVISEMRENRNPKRVREERAKQLILKLGKQ